MNVVNLTNIAKSLIGVAIASLAIVGCSTTEEPENISESECPDKPEIVLKAENVKAIALTPDEIIESGNVSRRKHKGYSFPAKTGQRFSYRTEQELCLWFYDPENKLLEEIKFERDGNYVIQISVSRGSTTFELAMSLTDKESASSPVTNHSSNQTTISNNPSPANSLTQNNLTNSANSQLPNNPPSITRPDPKEVVQRYYSNINNGQYSASWQMLPFSIQKDRRLHPDGYNSYYNWWVTVDKIGVKNVNLEEVNANAAIVDIGYDYYMKKGNISPQSLRFFLAWNDQQQEWRIERIKVNS